MQFKWYSIPIKTGRKFVAVFAAQDAKKLDIRAGDRVKLSINGNKDNDVTALVDVSDNSGKEGIIGLFSETHQELNIKRFQKVTVDLIEKPVSVELIKSKLNGKKLSQKDLNAIVNDIIEDNFTDTELTYFVSGCYLNGLDDEETANLTKAIVNHGKKLKFASGKIMDKHCIGGVPGNRTTMLVTPIVTAAGLKMPKTSSRSITSPAGTADTMEALANVTIEAPDLKKIAQKINGFIAWGGGVDIASADDHLIRVRHPLSLDPEGMMLASIMAKKFAVGSTHVLIDIPYGPNVKVKSKKDADHLKSRFEKIGKMLKMHVKVILTHGTQPIGNGIGPMLEAMDVMSVLRNEKTAPTDLRKKSLEMSGLLLEMGGKAKPGQGLKLAEEILSSGKALKQMEAMITAQGKSKYAIRHGKYHEVVTTTRSGKVKTIDNKTIAKIARIAGSPDDKYAGVYLHKKVGQTVKSREPLYTIYSETKNRLKEIGNFKLKNPYEIG